MLLTLASLLLLGTVPAQATPAPLPSLPGIEIMTVTQPNDMAKRFIEPELTASGVILIDAISGQEIYARTPDERRPIASLTKIMTALILLENSPSLHEIVTVPPIAEQIRGSTIGLTSGQKMRVESLLKAMLISSANEAAYTLAAYQARSVGAFVQKMNQRTEQLGLKNTHFANPAGLDHPEQYSTPRELAWLTTAALKHPFFRETVSTRSLRIFSEDGKQYDLRNTNEILHFNEDVYGVKTGTTDSAGECLIIYFYEGNHPYLLVLLRSSDRYTDALHILQAVRTATK